jgi:hypothetical protein
MAADEAQKQKQRRARSEARRILEEVARAGTASRITYKTLADRIVAQRYADNSQAFTELLCQVSRATLHEGRGALSAVVVRSDRGFPGDGFFTFLHGLGRLDVPADEMAAEEMREAWRRERLIVDEAWRPSI